jgi:hypothetical protein
MRAVFGIVLLVAAILPSAGNAQAQYRSVTSVNAEWQKLPPAMGQCIRSELRQHGLDIAALVQQGVLPSDPRLGRVMSECSDASFDNAEAPYQQRRPGNVFSDTPQSLPSTSNDAQQPVNKPTPPISPSQQRSATENYFPDKSAQAPAPAAMPYSNNHHISLPRLPLRQTLMPGVRQMRLNRLDMPRRFAKPTKKGESLRLLGCLVERL